MTHIIKNEETKIKKDTKFNDIDILNDTLLTFKFLTDNYAIALNEASNKTIYEKYKEIFDVISQKQTELFQLSFKKGWYKLEEADKTKINKAFKEYTKKQKELSVN